MLLLLLGAMLTTYHLLFVRIHSAQHSSDSASSTHATSRLHSHHEGVYYLAPTRLRRVVGHGCASPTSPRPPAELHLTPRPGPASRNAAPARQEEGKHLHRLSSPAARLATAETLTCSIDRSTLRDVGRHVVALVVFELGSNTTLARAQGRSIWSAHRIRPHSMLLCHARDPRQRRYGRRLRRHCHQHRPRRVVASPSRQGDASRPPRHLEPLRPPHYAFSTAYDKHTQEQVFGRLRLGEAALRLAIA